MTKQQLERRADSLEAMIGRATNDELPALNRAFQSIMERLVALDLSGADEETK